MSKLKKRVFEEMQDIAEHTVPRLEHELRVLKRKQEETELFLKEQNELVKEACEQFGFVLIENPNNRYGEWPYKLEMGEE
jgi:predicted secreted acid phosphatase